MLSSVKKLQAETPLTERGPRVTALQVWVPLSSVSQSLDTVHMAKRRAVALGLQILQDFLTGSCISRLGSTQGHQVGRRHSPRCSPGLLHGVGSLWLLRVAVLCGRADRWCHRMTDEPHTPDEKASHPAPKTVWGLPRPGQRHLPNTGLVPAEGC